MYFMFSYFEPNFIEKFHWDFFSKFWSRDCFRENENSFFGRHFETQHFLNVLFADLWLF